MELKPGYKQTEVGVIPEEWGVVTASDACSLVVDCKNRTPPIVDHSEYAVVRTPNVRDGRFIQDDLRFTDESSYREWTARAVPQAGDIMITREAPLGEVCAVPDAQKVCLGQRMMLYRPSPSKTDSRYLLYSLMSLPVRANLMRKIGGSTVGHAKVDDIRFLKLPLPPLPEQRAIASLLSDTDSLLASLEQLIAKKLDIKQAAMQELLTGKRRLPGFEGEWEVKRLGHYVRFLKNGVNSRAELQPEGRIKYLHYGDIHASRGSFLSPQELTGLSVAKAAGLDRLQDGDLIFADASEDIAGVSRSVELCGTSNFEAVSGLHTIAARFDKAILADGFKGFLQYVPSFSTHLRRLAAGTKVYATNRAHILSAEVRLPPVAEQQAIANVLIDMSNEIGVLQERMNKTCSTKQGMMQQLLTGKIRLT